MVGAAAAVPVVPLRSQILNIVPAEVFYAFGVDALVEAGLGDGDRHEEEVSLGCVLGDEAALLQRLLEELLAGVVP